MFEIVPRGTPRIISMEKIMKNNVVCCGIQLNCDDSRKNMLKRAELYIEKAVREIKNRGLKLDILVLPEQFIQMPETAEKYGEEYGMNGEGMQEWASMIARKYDTNVFAGTYPHKDEKIYNRCLVVDRQGNVKGKYDKIHLFDAFNVKESDTFEAGTELGIFDLDVGRVGVWICYDSRFPEISRALREREADIFVVPAAFYKPNYRHWEILINAAAITNVTPIIAVNQGGRLSGANKKICNNSMLIKGNEKNHDNVTENQETSNLEASKFVGNSMILDAYGDECARLGDEEGYMIGVIDKDYTRKCRENNPEYSNRRIDLYKKWL